MTRPISNAKTKIEKKAILSFNTRNDPTIQQGQKLLTLKGTIDKRRVVGQLTVNKTNLDDFCETIPDRSFKLWKHSMKTPATRLGYIKVMLKFMQKQVDEGKLSDQLAFDELAKLDHKMITEMCEDWIIEKTQKLNPNSVEIVFYPVELFFNQNDVILNWKRLHKMFPQKIKPKNRKAYSQDDMSALYDGMLDTRSRSLLTFLGSSSIRVGALEEMQLKHIGDYKDCKLLTVYANTLEEYKTFISPEASHLFDKYLEERKEAGENVTPESWAFVSQYTAKHKVTASGKRLNYEGIYKIVERAGQKAQVRIAGKRQNTKTLERRDIANIHGIRKFAETTFNNERLHQNYINILTGHTSANLDVSTYWNYEDNINEVYAEYIKCLPKLAISQEARRKFDVLGAKSLSTEQELAYEQRITDQEKKIKELETLVLDNLTNPMTQRNTKRELYKPLSQLREQSLFLFLFF